MEKIDNLLTTIKLLNKEYQIACPPNEEGNLKEAASRLDQIMEDIRNTGKVVGIERIAIMSAINMAHETVTLQKELNEAEEHVMDTLANLCYKIDDVMEKNQEKSTADIE